MTTPAQKKHTCLYSSCHTPLERVRPMRKRPSNCMNKRVQSDANIELTMLRPTKCVFVPLKTQPTPGTQVARCCTSLRYKQRDKKAWCGVSYFNDTWHTGFSNGKRKLNPIRTMQKKPTSHKPTACTQHDDGTVPKSDRNCTDDSCQDTVSME